ncbi:alpha/beta-hydrolase family protein [Demequina sp. NBRC 110055]|uniref:alpha/beta-hydrolase family protein n=1 Tax=Demequina sp. NBRC 110055 TaxID=1570344 RepID=UPI001F32A836|nr:alpha/beta-hydrolase family protein [Demequina sp. NBRC 110055]
MLSWGIRRLDVVGSAFGVFFVVLSLTPSLLPRPSWGQGLVTGLSFAVGYGFGVLTWRVLRLVTGGRVRWDASAPGWIVAVATLLAFLAVLPLGVRWQNDVREAVGLPDADGIQWLAGLIAALLGVWLGMGIGRGIRRLHNRLRPWAARAVSAVSRRDAGARPAAVSLSAGLATTLGVIVIVAVGTTVLSLLLTGLYNQRNNNYDPAFAQPTSALRSGSPDSLVKWEDVGQAGVKIVGDGPTVEEIAAVTDLEATEPIRIYVGINSPGTVEERAQLAVAELERTGAAERSQLLVAGTTGTGWLDPAAIDGFEYLHAGDTALVTMQYGSTPSPVSALLTPELAPEGTSALFDAVYAWWSELPEDSRPELTVYGLSLGSYGMNAAFDTEEDLLTQTDGAVLAGTPSFTALWKDLNARRDAGSPIFRPVLDEGENIRWAEQRGDLEALDGQWNEPHIAYLQHGDDPIVWIGPSVIWSHPEWLRDRQRSPMVSDDMFWIPGVTAFQGVIDLILSQGVPEDAGHKYGNIAVYAFESVTGDAGLSDEARTRIEEIIATYDPYYILTY